jgi:hypothetical protein
VDDEASRRVDLPECGSSAIRRMPAFELLPRITDILEIATPRLRATFDWLRLSAFLLHDGIAGTFVPSSSNSADALQSRHIYRKRLWRTPFPTG